MKSTEEPLHAPTKLEIIRQKVAAYHKKMNWIADFLDQKQVPQEYRINKSKEFMEFYIDLEALESIYKFKNLENVDRVAVYFGLTDGSDSLTGCFLAIDKDNNVLDNHRPGGGPSKRTERVEGEDTWLPPGKPYTASNLHEKDFTLNTSWPKIEQHLK